MQSRARSLDTVVFAVYFNQYFTACSPFYGLSSFASAMTGVLPRNGHFNPVCDATQCSLLGILLCSSSGQH